MKLYHVSEEPVIEVFIPRPSPQAYDKITGNVVFAVSDEMLHNYLLPRECPRVTYFAKEDSMQSDIDEFIGSSTKKYFINIEEGWFERVIQSILYLYELPTESFELLDEGAGYYISYETIKPIDIYIVSDAIYEIEKRNTEIRTLPSLKQLAERISRSSLQFSIIRLRSAI